MAAIQSRQPNMTGYDATYRDFRWEVPAQYNFAVDTIGRWAQDPARLALWWVSEDGAERKITYAEMAAPHGQDDEGADDGQRQGEGDHHGHQHQAEQDHQDHGAYCWIPAP